MSANSNDLYVNIKALPITYDVASGDYFIVETSTGTRIVDFDDFIITLDNTNFKGLIDAHSTAIVELSSGLQDVTYSPASVSAVEALRTEVARISASVAYIEGLNLLTY